MRKFLVMAGVLAALPLAPAAAQDVSATPVFGSVTLNANFTPDPHSVDIVAGGPVNASGLGGACVGNIGNGPDYRLTYTPGQGLPLFIRAIATSGADLSLVVNGPDGSWSCNDDTNGLDPEVAFAAPRAGVYDIFVGVVSGAENPQGRLQISEIPGN